MGTLWPWTVSTCLPVLPLSPQGPFRERPWVNIKICGVVAHAMAQPSEVHPFLLDRMTVWLSTAPTEPLTHWYQVRCLFQSPLFAKAGDTLSGTCLLIANKRCTLTPIHGWIGQRHRGLPAQLPHSHICIPPDRAMTSVLWPRWTRQAPNPVTCWI